MNYSKLEVTDHPLPTPPSIPPDTIDQVASSEPQQEDPLSASPVLTHPATIDAFTSDVRDEPSSPSHPPLSQPPDHKVDIPHADISVTFDRPLSEPPNSMEVDQKFETTEMVNGHKDEGEYTAEDMFSGPAVESPQPTNEPTPPPTDQRTLAASPSMTSGVEQAPDVIPPSTTEPTSLPQQPSPPVLSTPTPVNNDVEMTNSTPPAPPPSSGPKPVREAPSVDEPPAKRLKTEPTSFNDPSRKQLPAPQQKFLVALLRQVKKARDARPFLEPVDPVKLNIPRYFDVITNPMDLSTIESKLNRGAYSTAQEFTDDFNLMIENCVKFNGPENPITKMAKNIQATFEKGMKSLPPETVPPLPRS